MKVPIIDLVAAYNEQKDALDAVAIEVLQSGWYVSGPNVKKLEDRFADYCGAKESIAVASGTEALRLALQAYGIGEGDEILTPAFTFFACSSTIALNSAIPVFVDMNPDDFNLDLDDLEKRVTPKTKGIIVVHLYGHPARMDEILEFAKKHNLFVIEDCAQAIGAEYDGKKVGSMGDVGTFSFYPTKNLHACGDGGIITGSNHEIMDKIRLLRNHGENPRYTHHLLGANGRMDEIQAALILVKFDLIDKWNARRREIAEMYLDGFKNLPVTTPPEKDSKVLPVFHAFTIRVEEKRDELFKYLQEKEIGVMLYYPKAMHQQPVFSHLGYSDGDYPEAEKACNQVMSIPVQSYLSDEQVQFVIDSIAEFYK